MGLALYASRKAAAASLIIVGDDMLTKQMTLSVMTPIRTRLTVNFRIDPLDEKETEQFIAFRLRCAQTPKDLFEPDALALVAAHCHGNRREIMNLGTLLLSEAFYRNENSIPLFRFFSNPHSIGLTGSGSSG